MDTRPAEELIAIIIDYHGLREGYADALRPRSQPVSAAFPEASNIAAWRARHDVLAVQKPFYPTFCEPQEGTYSEGQEFAMEFCSGYNRVRRRLEQYCFLHGLAQSERNVPLALPDADVKASIGEGILDALNRHTKALIQLLSEEGRLSVRLVVDFPNVLREARKAAGLSQTDATAHLAKTLSVNHESLSPSTYKDWEAGDHRPHGRKWRVVEEFIRKNLAQRA
jgi:hypothetical protein